MSILRNLLIQKAKNEPIWLEYIESTGTQYINTGINSSLTTIFNQTVEFTDLTTYQLSGGDSSLWFGIKADGKICGGGATSTVTATLGTKYKISCYYDSSNRRCIDVNGTEFIGSGDNYGYIYSLFCLSSSATNPVNSSSYNRLKAKLYSCQIYDSGVLVRDFRPCLNPITLKPALYDVVNNQYYYNQGTGEFQYNQ